MESREEKEYVSAVQIEEFIVSTEKYKELHYQLNYFPDFQATLIDKLLLAILTTHAVEDKISILKSLLMQLREVIDNAKHHHLSINDFYELVYIKLLNDENIKKIYSEINKAFETGKIILAEHLQATEVLRKLMILKPTISMRAHEEKLYLSEEKLSEIRLKPLFYKAMEKFMQQYKVTNYLKNIINNGYLEIAKDDPAIAVLDRIKGEFFRLPPDAFREFTNVINIHYKMLPAKIKEKLETQRIIDRIQTCIDEESILTLKAYTIKFLLNEKETHYDAEENKHCYNQASSNIIQLLNTYTKLRIVENHSGYKNDSEAPRDPFLMEYIFNLVKNNSELKNIYLLPYLQRVINGYYAGSKNQIANSVNWLNAAINNLLMKENFKPAALMYVSKAAIAVLLRVTDPDVFINMPALSPAAYRVGYYVSEFRSIKSDRSLPKGFRDKLEKYTASDLAKKDNFSEDDLERESLLNDLFRKELQYIHDLKNAFYSHSRYQDQEAIVAQKLLLRLVAVDYLREKIQSGVKLSSDKIQKEMYAMFGDLMFETRGCFSSHITKMVARLNLPASSKLYFGDEKKEGSSVARLSTSRFFSKSDSSCVDKVEESQRVENSKSYSIRE